MPQFDGKPEHNRRNLKSPLTDVAIKALKAKDKTYRVFDTKGLYIEITSSGSKLWRYRYWYDGKEKRLSFGPYPEVKLSKARELRDKARENIRNGTDPAILKKKQKNKSNNTFRLVAQEWLSGMKNVWSARHAEDVVTRLEKNVYPSLGDVDISEITPTDVLKIMRIIEDRGAHEIARRTMGTCSQIFRYAVATEKAPSDPCRDLRGALVPFNRKNYAAITRPKEVGHFLNNIENYVGSIMVTAAMKFSALTFCRPGEIRQAEWTELDWDEREWRIPAHKMKARQEHRVPLADQAVKILEEMKFITGTGLYIFPSARSKDRPMSENAVLAAIRTMGYTKDEMTPHGFRAMASTLLNELGYRPDIIEAQLAHKEADKVRAAYNRAQYMQERRKLMQDWADYLDKLLAEAQKRNDYK